MSKLTQEAKAKCLHDALGRDEWLVMKRGLYYRAGGCGYTGNVSDAGRYTRREAERHEYKKGDRADWVTTQLAPVPDYFGDIGAALGAVKHAVTELLEEDQVTLLGRRVAGRYALDTLSGSDEEVHYAFANMLASLTAADYAEALGQALGLWKEGE